MTNNAPSFRERALARAEEFIRNNVPVHTRAQYESLLATNTDLALELIAKWRDLEDLKASYYQLQRDAAKQTAPMPPVLARARSEFRPDRLETITAVTWEIDVWQAQFAVNDLNKIRKPPELIVEAFRHVFHEDYVPALWGATEKTLWPEVVRQRSAA